jgi:hypothetical protein
VAIPQHGLPLWGRLQDANSRLLLLAMCLGLCVPLDVGLHLYSLLWKPRDAFISSPYGPGLERAGEVSDTTAIDFASEWFQLRYTWRAETYRRRMDEVLRHTHQNYVQVVKAEMDRDGALVSSGKMSSVVHVTDTQVVSRRSPVIVRVQLTAYHTLYQGSELLQDVQVTMDVLVYAVGMGKQKAALVTANSTGLPPLAGKQTAKGKT